MLKKTITFKDLDGNDVTEDFYFNLSLVELAEMEITREGISDKLLKIVASNNTAQIFNEFKNILHQAVGRRSEDNKRFIKDDEARSAFFESNAYEELFMEWIADGNAAAEFIAAVMPSDLEAKAAELTAKQKTVTDVNLPEQPAWITEGRVPSEAELVGATPDQLREAFRRKSAQ